MKNTWDLGKFQHQRRIALAFLVAFLAIALLFVRSAWQSEIIHEYTKVLGLSLIVVAVVGRMWCTMYIGGRKSYEIVSAGPYSITRNPLYLFSTIGAIGVGAQSSSITIALGFGLLCYIAFRIVIWVEERFLRNAFGATYERYCSIVPRFLPRFSVFRDEETLTVKLDSLYRTMKDGLVFFVAYPTFEIVEHLQNAHILPVLLVLY